MGAMTYSYIPATAKETTNRIQIPITVELDKSFDILAVLDTGAPYPILDPVIAKTIGFRPELTLERTTNIVRGIRLEGSLIRLGMTLQAEKGQNLTVDATAFVPDSEESWSGFPSFIGQTGFLERVRFAIDPNTNTFYFGSP